jgi:Zn-dependent peptidase ImmA (M78 family)
VKQSSIKRRDGRALEAVVERNGALAMSAEERDPRGGRFLFARALHHWLFVDSTAHGPRLLTRGSDWQQAASRAFAAELLAPAEALQQRLERGQGDWDADVKLAEEFDVSPRVIVHQRDNHQLV